MNYPTYAYAPRFGAPAPAVGFSQPMGYPGAPVPMQSAPAPVSAPGAGGFIVQPVSSREEALAVIADPMAAGVLLPDLGHGVVYLKRFNPQTGTSDFAEFAYAAPQAAAPQEQPDYLTRKEFEDALAQLRAELTPKAARGKREVTDE